MLTNRYLKGIPKDSRAGKSGTYLSPEDITEDKIARVRKLHAIAQRRGQSMAEMAIAWILRLKGITSVLVGASRVEQINDNVSALKNLQFTSDELAEIDAILK